MSLFIVGGFTAAVASFANSQEDSPLLWGILTFMLCLIGKVFLGYIGCLMGGLIAFGLLQFKLAKYG